MRPGDRTRTSGQFVKNSRALAENDDDRATPFNRAMTYRRRLFAIALMAASAAVTAPATADPLYPQAAVINADFLRSAPAPATPTAMCVVDTGVSPVAELGDGRIIRSVSVFGPNETGEDVGGLSGSSAVAEHGTLVASTAARLWPHLRIVSVRLSPGYGQPLAASLYPDAIAGEDGRFCGEPSVRVINLSFGAPSGFTGTQASWRTASAIEKAITARDVDVVAAAGNAGQPACGDPGHTPLPGGGFADDALCVGAVGAGGERCVFSNFGTGVDLYAGGCNVVASGKGGLSAAAGTSFAAPAVSAVIAALRAYRPDLTAAAVEGLLTQTAARPAGAPGPVVDAAAAFRAAGLGALVDTPAAAPTPIGTTSEPGTDEKPQAPWQPSRCPAETRKVHAPRGTVTVRRRVARMTLTCIPENARLRVTFLGRGRTEFSVRRVATRVLSASALRPGRVSLRTPKRWVELRVTYLVRGRSAAQAMALASSARGKRGTSLAVL